MTTIMMITPAPAAMPMMAAIGRPPAELVVVVSEGEEEGEEEEGVSVVGGMVVVSLVSLNSVVCVCVYM